MINGMPTVLISIPSGKYVDARLLCPLVDLMAHHDGVVKRLSNPQNCYVQSARNMAVDCAQQLEADYLLFIDSDMEFPADTLKRLLSHKKDIVGATYVKRTVPHHVLGRRLHSPWTIGTVGLVEMETTPAGCLLIRLEVFKRLKKPYFRLPFNEETGEEGSDDYDFCLRARDANWRIWCDADLSRELGHVGDESFKIIPHGAL